MPVGMATESTTRTTRVAVLTASLIVDVSPDKFPTELSLPATNARCSDVAKVPPFARSRRRVTIRG